MCATCVDEEMDETSSYNQTKVTTESFPQSGPKKKAKSARSCTPHYLTSESVDHYLAFLDTCANTLSAASKTLAA
jgi:hypothetical protein